MSYQVTINILSDVTRKVIVTVLALFSMTLIDNTEKKEMVHFYIHYILKWCGHIFRYNI